MLEILSETLSQLKKFLYQDVFVIRFLKGKREFLLKRASAGLTVKTLSGGISYVLTDNPAEMISTPSERIIILLTCGKFFLFWCSTGQGIDE